MCSAMRLLAANSLYRGQPSYKMANRWLKSEILLKPEILMKSFVGRETDK
jgi:hypothetical protein